MPETTAELAGRCAAHAPVLESGHFPVGTLFGDWRLTAFIGRGGNGEVYCAEHVLLGTPAAVKVLVRSDERTRVRFAREARLLAQLKSPAFPRFLAYGEAEGVPYLAMELLEPGDVPTGDRAVARFLLAVCAGVAELHAHGLVHRDIKPGNILWRREADAAQGDGHAEPVLADLGLVKNLAKEEVSAADSLTVVEGRRAGVGTPGYGAPEQMERGEVTVSSDIHALGVLADRCFGGRPPRVWKRIVQRATSSIPRLRYPTVAAFSRVIRHRHMGRNVGLGIVATAFGVAIATVGAVFLSSTVKPVEAATFSSAYATWREIATSVVSNGVIYTTVNLQSNRHEIVDLIELKGPQILSVQGPGLFFAPISGSSNVTIRLKGCRFFNRTRVPYPQNAMGYVLEGEDCFLGFPLGEYPTNRVLGAKRMSPYISFSEPAQSTSTTYYSR